MKKLIILFQQIQELPIVKRLSNFYAVVLIIFMSWMLLFDGNNIIAQISRYRQLKKLKEEKVFYSQKIEEVQKERQEIFGNPALLEKFAREKYLMKRADEDIYIVVEDE
jgi:cell division protein FtsB